MATFDVPNAIVAGEKVRAAPIQANFDAVEDMVNNGVAHLDGSLEFTALPSAPEDSSPTGGELVTAAALNRATGVVAKRIKNEGSLWATGPDWTDLSVNLGPFSWPTIEAGRQFQVTMFSPEVEVDETTSGYPTTGIGLEVGLFLGGTLLTICKVVTTSIGAFGPDDINSPYLQRTWFDQSFRAAGTTTTLSLQGRIRSGPGKFRLKGSGAAPLEFIARMG